VVQVEERLLCKFKPQSHKKKKKKKQSCLWFIPVILATQEAENRRITIQSQPGQIVCETPISKKPIAKKGWWSGSR
jgi:hypothetical protein